MRTFIVVFGARLVNVVCMHLGGSSFSQMGDGMVVVLMGCTILAFAQDIKELLGK